MRGLIRIIVFIILLIIWPSFIYSFARNFSIPKTQTDSLYVYPTSITVDIDPGSQVYDMLTICNQSDTTINYNLDFICEEPPSFKPKYYCREQFQYDINNNLEFGIETDGEFLYTSQSNNTIFKYNLSGVLLDTLIIETASTIWDLAFDGTYFYGGSGQIFIYEMDFVNEELVSIINTSVPVKALAYNETMDVFYGTSGNIITCFDRNGTTLNEIPVAIENLNGISGLAYDGYSNGGPYIWLFGHHQDSENLLVRLPLSGTSTNLLMCDVAKIIPSTNGIAGGLCIDNHLQNGYWTISGVMTNEFLFGLELTFDHNWFSYSPDSGTLNPDDCEEIEILFNPDGEYLSPGIYEGILNVTSDPNIGNEAVEIELIVYGGYFSPINLTHEIVGMSVILNWEHPIIPGDFEYMVYANTHPLNVGQTFTHVFGPLEPGIEMYYIGTLISGFNTPIETSYPASVIISGPQLVPPKNFNAFADSTAVLCNWVSPGPVTDLYGFNVYRNEEQLNTTILTDTFYFDMNAPFGNNYYYATSIYEYGESENSDTATVVISSIRDLFGNAELSLFPNPTSNIIIINSPVKIQSIQIKNNNGLEVFRKEINSLRFELNLSDLKTGIYYFCILTEKDKLIRKVLVN